MKRGRKEEDGRKERSDISFTITRRSTTLRLLKVLLLLIPWREKGRKRDEKRRKRRKLINKERLRK
jgi:hypothetical protein